MSAPLVFLDTETTGVHPDREVWEVAMIRRDAAGQRETSFMVDVDLSGSDPFGLRVGRFWERHPTGQYLSSHTGTPYEGERLSVAQAAEQVALWTYGAHVIGAVPNFDTEVLGRLLREHGLAPAWHYHLVDVENLAVGFLSGRRAEWLAWEAESESPAPESMCPWPSPAPPWSSEDLSRACGVEPATEDERHTALGDARWAMRLYDAITGGTS